MQHPTTPTARANIDQRRWRRSAQRSAVALFGVVAVATIAAPASATITETTHFAGTLHDPSANPCTGAPGTMDVTFAGVSHTTTNADGTLHHAATVHGAEAFEPDDPGLPSYAGRFTARDGQNGAVGQTITSTATFHDTLTGSDGSMIHARGVFHLTIRADGNVASSLDRVTLNCL